MPGLHFCVTEQARSVPKPFLVKTLRTKWRGWAAQDGKDMLFMEDELRKMKLERIPAK